MVNKSGKKIGCVDWSPKKGYKTFLRLRYLTLPDPKWKQVFLAGMLQIWR